MPTSALFGAPSELEAGNITFELFGALKWFSCLKILKRDSVRYARVQLNITVLHSIFPEGQQQRQDDTLGRVVASFPRIPLSDLVESKHGLAPSSTSQGNWGLVEWLSVTQRVQFLYVPHAEKAPRTSETDRRHLDCFAKHVRLTSSFFGASSDSHEFPHVAHLVTSSGSPPARALSEQVGLN